MLFSFVFEGAERVGDERLVVNNRRGFTIGPLWGEHSSLSGLIIQSFNYKPALV